jgi:hypothetical protein
MLVNRESRKITVSGEKLSGRKEEREKEGRKEKARPS